MKGTTNSQRGTGGGGEKLVISLKTNQASHEDLIGAKFSVVINGNATEYTWQGASMTIAIPPMLSYTVEFGEEEGYAKPESVTHTAVAGNDRFVTGTYNTELVTVNVSADKGNVSGYEIQIISDGNVLYTQTTPSASYKIPYGTSYMVKASDISGYTTPAIQLFTAAKSVRELGMVYEKKWNGVRIQGVSGKTYSVYSWNEQETVNGIALKTENCGLVIPLISSTQQNVVNTSETDFNLSRLSYTQALVDYNGEGNTNQLLRTFKYLDDSCGLIKCYNYIFPNGQRGFLPSFGQLDAIFNNLAAVNEALNIVGGNAIPTDLGHWSSSRGADNQKGWYTLWVRMDYTNSLGNKYGSVYMSSISYVRPITTL